MPAPTSAHVVLQVKNRDHTEYDILLNGELIGQLRLIDGEWRSLVPGDFGKAANLTEGTNLLLLQYYTQFN